MSSEKAHCRHPVSDLRRDGKGVMTVRSLFQTPLLTRMHAVLSHEPGDPTAANGKALK